MIKLHDVCFEPYLTEVQIQSQIQKMSHQIQLDFKGEIPIFLGVLNGSFMFCADLVKQFVGDCEVHFVKLSSYQKMESTGEVLELIGLEKNLEDRTVIVVEDIVDTGNTLQKIMEMLKPKQAKAIKIATLFLKPSVYTKNIQIDYIGFQIPNDFIVGYGLDYEGLGRNLREVYKVKD